MILKQMKHEAREVETVQDVVILDTLSRADFYSQSCILYIIHIHILYELHKGLVAQENV